METASYRIKIALLFIFSSSLKADNPGDIDDEFVELLFLNAK